MHVDERRVSGLIRGALGGVAGLVAMRLVTEASRAMARNGHGRSDGASSDGGASEGPLERHDELDEIAIGEKKTREDEPATATVGRLAYRKLEGEDPDEETRRKLGQAVHWGYGVLMGGVYGLTRADAETPDVLAGLGFGTALWALGDELAVPLLGLAEGPTAHRWTDHATALGAHLLYGAATAATTQALARVV